MLNPLSGDANYSVSNSGTLVYAPLGSFSGLDASLMWIDRHGSREPLLDTSRAYANGKDKSNTSNTLLRNMAILFKRQT